MTTAVRPGNGKTWEQVFENYPDEHPVWTLINSTLEAVALFGRFGFIGNPHEFQQDKWSTSSKCESCSKPKKDHPIELTLDEQVMLSRYQTAKEAVPDIAKPWEVWNDAIKNRPEGTATTDLIELIRLGLQYYYLLKIGATNPQVGHFVGRGFDQNSKDADRFLRVEKS